MIQQELPVDLSKPVTPMECMACRHFGRNDAYMAICAREVAMNQWLVVCETCRKEMHWSSKRVIKLNILLN